jgi:hypothetical protein
MRMRRRNIMADDGGSGAAYDQAKKLREVSSSPNLLNHLFALTS